MRTALLCLGAAAALSLGAPVIADTTAAFDKIKIDAGAALYDA